MDSILMQLASVPDNQSGRISVANMGKNPDEYTTVRVTKTMQSYEDEPPMSAKDIQQILQ